ncbi:MAG: sigma-70 family RNA polymerase sigma factor [Bacilli bacterium]|nr:sigma-70 family RNA polymerase sigma factor [Bacilli bacterium]
MEYHDFNDYELISMLHESSEEAKNILYNKYLYIIDIEIKKYQRMARVLGYDLNDLYQDALVGFSDALISYRDDKDAALSSFITLCVDRRLQVSIKKAGRLKNKLLNDSLSLEHIYESSASPLMDMLSDNFENDPLENIVKEEKTEELMKEIKRSLSNREYEVFSLVTNGLKYDEIALLLNKDLKYVDNAIQRMRAKIRKIVEE